MRNNLPVTQQEYTLEPGVTIVSRTDLQGRILYANPAFIEASGFDWSEIEGQPHNILRHPDVPEHVFDDFWATLKKGLPWTQIVKNRRKNGDHYWVEANATPIFENGKVTGFMSVRKPATSEQVKNAEQAYKAINAGQLRLEGGLPVTALHTFTKPLRKMSLATQLLLLVLLLGSIPFVLGFLGVNIPSWVMELEVLVMAGLVYAVGRNMSKKLDANAQALADMANGKFDTPISTYADTHLKSLPERYRLSAQLKSMQTKLGNDFDDTQRLLNEALRVQIALDVTTANIMVADQNNNIVFMNKALADMLKGLEPKLKAVLPHFDADNIVGQNVDIFHAHPEHQKGMISALQNRLDTNIEVAGLTLNLIMSPVKNHQGRRLGTVVEWRDMTQQLAIEEQINTLIDQASLGYIADRLNAGEMEGFYASLAKQVNGLMDSFESIVQQVSDVTVAMSEGDLTKRIEGQYMGELEVLKESMNGSIARMSRTIAEIMETSNTIKTSSEEVARGSMDLSDRTQKQAAALEETSAAMEEMTATVRQNAESAIEVSRISHSAREDADRGEDIVRKAALAMDDISRSSEKITEIMSLIDSIAFQTNLLALNAAVEAARAGDHGRGFAVVAGEVRTLAQRSANASKDIKVLIEESRSSVTKGAEYVASTVEALMQISQSVRRVNDITTEIAHASEEQSTGIMEVNKSITEMDAVTQQNASLVEQTSAAADSMRAQTQEMEQAATFFKVKSAEMEHVVNFGASVAQEYQVSERDTQRARDVLANSKCLGLSRAINTHRSFVSKIHSMVESGRNIPDSLPQHTDCSFGKWVVEEGKQCIKDSSVYSRLCSEHETVHTYAQQCLESMKIQDKTQARMAFMKLKAQSEILIQLLDEAEESSIKSSSSSSVASKVQPQQAPVRKANESDDWEEF